MKYIFISQKQNGVGNYEIDGDSQEDILDELRFELECHDDWNVICLGEDFREFDVLLKGHYIDTLIATRVPEELFNEDN